MKKLLTLLFASFTLYSWAEEVPDSTATTLDEIVVQGSTQRVVKYGVEYIPGKKVKKAAYDAKSLLLHMQIPQLRVSPVDNSINTSAGDGVDIFIEYVPATAQDAQALRPEDVLRVEVLEYPQDPRFNSAAHVVNFIMQHYEWGGYTKMTAFASMLNDESVEGSVYQKFAYKKWIFDASASASGSWKHKYRDYKHEVFRDFDFDGRHYDEVSRISSTDGFKGRSNSQSASLRAAYQGTGSYISHTVSFSRNGVPEIRRNSTVGFSDGILPSTEAVSDDPNQSINVAAEGNYRFFLPKDNFLNAIWSFSHSGNRQSSFYRLGEESPIINANREKSYSPQITVYYSKDMGHDNTLRTMLSSYAQIYKTDYSGSYDGTQKLLSSESMLFLEYMHNWSFGLSLYSRVGVSYVLGRLNGTNIMNEWNPRLGLDLQYKINSKNNLSLEARWNNSHPQVNFTNTALVQSNELLWIQGNPDMKNTYGPTLKLSYSLIPTNAFSLSAAMGYEKTVNMPTYRFYTLPGHDGIIRTFSDENNEQGLSASVSATLRLLNNSLLIYASGWVRRGICTGIHPMRATSFSGLANATYYLSNASVTLFYQAPDKHVINTSGYVHRRRCAYGIMATYALGDFNVNVFFRNWFSKGRAYRTYDSHNYSSSEWDWTGWLDRSISLTLSYTFPYGKKLSRNEDLRNQAIKKSAILK